MDENLKGVAVAIQGLTMPELRKDPIVGRWVIIATERAKRPVPQKQEPYPSSGPCPFCAGNEKDTPHETPFPPNATSSIFRSTSRISLPTCFSWVFPPTTGYSTAAR